MATFDPHLPAVFGALSDPTRLAVVERLMQGPASVSELARPFDLAGPSFLKHLKVLEAAGLTQSAKHGRVRTLALRPEGLQWIEAWMARHRKLWEHRLDDLDAFLERSNN